MAAKARIAEAANAVPDGSDDLGGPERAARRAAETAAAAAVAARTAAAAQSAAKAAAAEAAEAARAATQTTIVAATSESEALIANLDRAYQALLDQLEQQTNGAAVINADLRRALKVASETPVVDYQPDRALSPQEAFRSLAETLVRKERPRLDPHGSRKDVRYDDLLRWPDEPSRGNLTVVEYALTRIEHARSKSIRAFYDALLVRLAPEVVPAKAATYVHEELVETFAVFVPPNIVVPFTPSAFGDTLYLRLTRRPLERPWHLSERQFMRLEQGLLALSTACAMGGEDQAAVCVTTAGNELMARLREDRRRYKHGDEQHGGTHLHVVLLRDKIEVRVSRTVMAVVRAAMLHGSTKVEFVRN